jgi:hypothetical protein
MAETATTGGGASLAKAQGTMIGAARFTAEYNAPSYGAIQKERLANGNKEKVMPKVGKFTFADLVDGEDMTAEQEIGMTNVTLTAGEVGAKIIITDKLRKQNGTTSIFTTIGSQAGEGFARKQDTDVQSLYSGLNGGTTFGAAGSTFSLGNFAANIAKARGSAEPFHPSYAIVHPNQAYLVTKSATAIGSATNMRVNDPREEKMLKNFFKINFNNVDLFESGNIVDTAGGDAIGVIAERGALVALESDGFAPERERDASRRAWEINWVADYGVFELDDSRGAPLTYDNAAPNDTA